MAVPRLCPLLHLYGAASLRQTCHLRQVFLSGAGVRAPPPFLSRFASLWVTSLSTLLVVFSTCQIPTCLQDPHTTILLLRKVLPSLFPCEHSEVPKSVLLKLLLAKRMFKDILPVGCRRASGSRVSDAESLVLGLSPALTPVVCVDALS